MRTPIYDFVKQYSECDAVRMHMPGHKGRGGTLETLDITEISGADSLYEADGIIKESETVASKIFDAHTFYSTEGSSLAIRAMLRLCCLYAALRGEKPLILAGRNAHKVFISAAALLNFDIEWIECEGSYLSCAANADMISARLGEGKRKPTAVYLTSPDYLGGRVDIGSIAKVCHEHGVLLSVDNAHGAYLKFLAPSEHPMDLGADMCADSAHKTLPVLTGGAYLHISKGAPTMLAEYAKDSMVLFGSTSPSYLILASLDRANKELSDGFPKKMSTLIDEIAVLKQNLLNHGYTLYGNEPLKITILSKEFGYLGTDLDANLRRFGIFSEFSDPDNLVLMLSTHTTDEDIKKVEKALVGIEKRPRITTSPPIPKIPQTVMSIRDAVMSAGEEISVSDSVGRVLSSASIGCPPAVPLTVAGELITEDAANAMKYYGITKVRVVNK